MDRANKYYTIIENAIRNHRKFPGFEPILEDLIDDVYLHSESVINNVEDEEVIVSYINKVAATSIITVPKKLGFQKEEPIQKPASTQEFVDSIFHSDKKTEVNKELVDKMINLPETESTKDKDADQTVIAPESEEIQGEFIEEIPVESINTMEEVSEENVVPELSSTQEDSSINYSEVSEIEDFNEIEVEEPQKIEEELILEDTKNEANETSELEIVSELPEDNTEEEFKEQFFDNAEESSFELIENNNSNSIEEYENPDSNTNTDEIADFELVEENVPEYYENDSNLSLDVEDEPVTNEFTLEDTLENDSLNILTENDINITDESIDLTDDLPALEDDSYINSNDESNSEFEIISEQPQLVQQEDFLELEDVIPDVEENVLEENFVIDDLESTSIIETENSPSPLEKDNDFKSVDYSVFNYAKKDNENFVDTVELSKSLDKLKYDRPELKIDKVFDLRFKQNKTILDIAVELNIDANKVVDALNEITALV